VAQVQSTLGKPKEALASYTQAIQILHDNGIKKEYGEALIGRGVLYQSWGDYDKALQDYKESLQLQRDMNNENYQALCLSNIGGVYLAKGDTDNAQTYLQQSLILRQKLNDPEYVALTLSSLGDVYTATGEYDKAYASVLSALENSRKTNNVRGAAVQSVQIGLILQYQGRLGAAVTAMQDAVKDYRSVDNHSSELADALNNLADTLVLAGRGDESVKPSQEAQEMARDLKDPTLDISIALAQGDAKYYAGDPKGARSAYEQALRSATQAKDRDKILLAKMNLARVTIADGHASSAISELRPGIEQADKSNLKYLSLRSTADLAEAMIASKDYAGARKQLERVLTRSEKLGSRVETARIHYLLGTAIRLGGSPRDAVNEYAQALRLLDDMKKEPGAEHLLDRSDLKNIYAESNRWFSAA